MVNTIAAGRKDRITRIRHLRPDDDLTQQFKAGIAISLPCLSRQFDEPDKDLPTLETALIDFARLETAKVGESERGVRAVLGVERS